MWHDSGSTEVEEIASSHQLKQPELLDLLETPTPWTSTRSTPLLEKEQSTCRTASALSAIKRGATHPNIRDTLEEEKKPHNKEHGPHGGLPKLGKLKEILGSTTS